MSGAKSLARKALSFALPIGGFGVGWLAFSYAEDNDWIGESTKREMNIANLKLQRSVQRFLPASVVEKYGYSEDMLDSMIDSMRKGYTEEAMNDRVTFDQILSECELPEQIGFLEEHASEDIPYFYIADIFHSWARLHEGSILRAENRSKKNTEREVSDRFRLGAGGALVLRDVLDFDSDILCNSLYDKMVSNVVPFDVSIRALCVLAVNNRANAKRLAGIGSAEQVLSLYDAYLVKDEQQEERDDLIDSAEVYAATLFFLRAVNDASIHKRWIPGVGKPSTGPFPLASLIDAGQWCRLFDPSTASSYEKELVAEPAAFFADLVSEKLRCSERSIA